VMPLLLVGNELTVAIYDPTRIDILDHLKRQIRYTVQPVLTTQSQILTAQAIYYAKLAEAQAPANDGSRTSDADQTALDSRRLEAKGKEIPIINIVNQILSQAIEEGASDIHVEPQEQGLLIRYAWMAGCGKYPPILFSCRAGSSPAEKYWPASTSRAPATPRWPHSVDRRQENLRL